MMISVTVLWMWAVTPTIQEPCGTNKHLSAVYLSFELQSMIVSKGKAVIRALDDNCLIQYKCSVVRD